ncbi:hypothetical protein SprV_0401598200 [Sparganum proliferum]
MDARKEVFFRYRRIIHHRLKEKQDIWMTYTAEETQGYADHNESKNSFASPKSAYGPKANLTFSVMLIKTYRLENREICIAYRTDDCLLNSRLVQTPTRLSTTNAHDLLFANYSALNVDAEADIQRNMELSAAGCANCGLTINTDKTVIMSRPPPNTVYSAPRIHVNGTQLNSMDKLAYLGSTLSHCIKIDNKVAHRVSKTSVSNRLRNSVWNRHGIRLNIKLKIYKAVILTTLLYDAETCKGA